MLMFFALPIYLLVAAFTRITLVPDTTLEYVLVGVLGGLVALKTLNAVPAQRAFARFDAIESNPVVRTVYRSAYKDAMKTAETPQGAEDVALSKARRFKAEVDALAAGEPPRVSGPTGRPVVERDRRR
jgi:hypothetical protein